MTLWNGIGTDISEFLTSVAAELSHTLLFEFNRLIVQMVNENLIGCCLFKLYFCGNVTLTVCSDFPSLLTNRLLLTPRKISIGADVLSESDNSNRTSVLRRCVVVHSCH